MTDCAICAFLAEHWKALAAATVALMFWGSVWHSYLFHVPWARAFCADKGVKDFRGIKMRFGILTCLLGSLVGSFAKATAILFVANTAPALFSPLPSCLTALYAVVPWLPARFAVLFAAGLGIHFVQVVSIVPTAMWEQRPITLIILGLLYELSSLKLAAFVLAFLAQ